MAFDCQTNSSLLAMLHTARANQFGSNDPRVIQWRIRFQQLQKYKEKHGSHVIPAYNPQYKELLDWLNQQRRILSIDGDNEELGILTQSRRIKFFESIGILEFSEPDAEDRHWDEHFKALLQFKSNHGHCLVPECYRTLYKWVVDQRNDYRTFVKSEESSELTVQRYLKLEALGFIWNTKLDMIEWMSQYNNLKSFQLVHGHCSVSWADPRDRELGFWVTAQRVKTRVSSEGLCRVEFLTFKQWTLLNKLGFEWQEPNPFLHNMI